MTRSIFAPRKKECDARSYFHHARLEDKIFEVDWTRIAKKTRFTKTLGSADDVARLRVVLRNNFMNIMHVSRTKNRSTNSGHCYSKKRQTVLQEEAKLRRRPQSCSPASCSGSSS